MSFRSKAGLGTVQVSSLSDGVYAVKKVEAGKPKAGFQNPLLTLEGISERVYLHPSKLPTCKPVDGEGIYVWDFPPVNMGLSLVVNNGLPHIEITTLEQKRSNKK